MTAEQVTATLKVALGGQAAGLLSVPREKEDVPIVVRLGRDERSSIQDLKELKVAGATGELVPLGELVRVVETIEDRMHHLTMLRDLQDETGGYLAYIPLAYHPDNNELGVTLGRTGLEVTTLGYGAMEMRGGGAPGAFEVSDEDADRVLNAVLDAGINFIDTSPDYGRSEDLIGASIAHRRAEYVLASKCGCVPGAGMGAEHVHTAENIRAGVEQSLRRMRTDHLDLVQFHRSLTRRDGTGLPRRLG